MTRLQPVITGTTLYENIGKVGYCNTNKINSWETFIRN